MNAKDLAFPAGSFDLVLCGFMGWYDCYDFSRGEFTRPERKAKGIRRVLRDGGYFVCCSWERQEDVTWMEETFLRHYPAILDDPAYLADRPIGMAYEKAEGYRIILESAGFTDITVSREQVECVSTDEEEWWQQMRDVGWELHFRNIEKDRPAELQRVKEAIFADLQRYKRADGIHFTKAAFFVRAVR